MKWISVTIDVDDTNRLNYCFVICESILLIQYSTSTYVWNLNFCHGIRCLLFYTEWNGQSAQ